MRKKFIHNTNQFIKLLKHDEPFNLLTRRRYSSSMAVFGPSMAVLLVEAAFPRQSGASFRFGQRRQRIRAQHLLQLPVAYYSGWTAPMEQFVNSVHILGNIINGADVAATVVGVTVVVVVIVVVIIIVSFYFSLNIFMTSTCPQMSSSFVNLSLWLVFPPLSTSHLEQHLPAHQRR